MKKFLLFAFAALMAVSVNAQLVKKAPRATDVKMTFAPQTINPVQGKMAFKAQAPEKEGIFGTYFNVAVEEDDVLVSTAITIEDSTYVDEEGNSYEGLKISNLGITGLCVFAMYDAEAGVITIPAQTAYTSSTYGTMTIVGLVNEDDENFSETISFTVEDDGVMYLDQSAWYLIIDEGDYAGYWYTRGVGDELHAANGVEQGYQTVLTGGWDGETKFPIYIQDENAYITIYGFFGQRVLQINVNEDGTLGIPTGQNMYTRQVSGDDDVYGPYLYIVNCYTTEEDSYIHTNWDDTEVPGAFATSTEDGRAALYFPDYFGIRSNGDADGLAYSAGYFVETAFILNEGNFLAGINNAIVEKNSTSKQTYNLMGQPVSKSYKGIVIENGKKVVRK